MYASAFPIWLGVAFQLLGRVDDAVKLVDDGIRHARKSKHLFSDRGEFRVAQDGGASLGFYDEHGLRRVLVGEASQGRNGLVIYGSSGSQLASLTAPSDNEASTIKHSV